jgi:hypothetical protein
VSLTCVSENVQVNMVFLTGLLAIKNTSAFRAYLVLKERQLIVKFWF